MKLNDSNFLVPIAALLAIVVLVNVRGSSSQIPAMPASSMPPSQSLEPQGSAVIAQSRSDFPMPDGTYLEIKEKCSVDEKEPDARFVVSSNGHRLAFNETQCTRQGLKSVGEQTEATWQCEKGSGFRSSLRQGIERVGARWKFNLEGEGVSFPGTIYELCPTVTVVRHSQAATPPPVDQKPNAQPAQGVFPLRDGRYLSASKNCVADDDGEFQGISISSNGMEMSGHEYACKRISYDSNSNGAGVIWKCSEDGENAWTLHQTIRPEGKFYQISTSNEASRSPQIEIYEHCPVVQDRKGITPAAQPPAKPSIKNSQYTSWRIDNDQKNEKITLFSEDALSSVVCHRKRPNVEFYFNDAPGAKIILNVPRHSKGRSIEYRPDVNNRIAFQLMKNDPAIQWMHEASFMVSSERHVSTYTFGQFGSILRDACASSAHGNSKPSEDTDAALWGLETPKWVEVIMGATLRPSSQVLGLCRDIASKQNFPRDHVIAHVRACFVRETDPRFLDQGLKAFQRDIIACRPRVGPLQPNEFNECLDQRLTAKSSAMLVPTGETVAYGTRVGMDAAITRKSGISTRRAVIEIRHTPVQAKIFCTEYANDHSEKCVRRTMGEIILRPSISANCETGEFTTPNGNSYRFLGKANSEHGVRSMIIDGKSGELLENNSASGIAIAESSFDKLCPAQFNR